MMFQCWGRSPRWDVKTTAPIYHIFTLHIVWNGKGVNTQPSCLSLLPSMDYLWAGDDRSAGLQSGWLGSGTFSLLFPHTHTHPRASKAIAYSLSLAAIPSLQHPPTPPTLPNVKIWFFFFFFLAKCITPSVLWKNNLLRVGIRGCSKWVEEHASSVSWTWPASMEFNCFFP